MHSLIWTGRVLSRALWSSITNDTHALESNVNRKRDSHLVSAVCGFPKDFFFSALRKGKFGDDAWFSAKYKTADVIGEYYTLCKVQSLLCSQSLTKLCDMNAK